MSNIIGTFVPISALISSMQQESDWGTFETGEIFLNWLKKTKQSSWQVLPLHETQLEPGNTGNHVSSPYKSYGIGLAPRYQSAKFKNITPSQQEKDVFVQQHAGWVHDYALFCALRDHFQTDDWRMWDQDIRERQEQALVVWTEKLAQRIDAEITLQWQLHQSYANLRKKAQEQGIALIGDLPFYLSVQSPLVWAHQKSFLLEADGSMPYVSGVPNTLGAHFGRQLWGHPLYKWQAREQWNDIVGFWKLRLWYLSTLFDFIRFDHAKAFFEYGQMDPQDEKNDTYIAGPGVEVFEELIRFSGSNGLQIFAEDSGEKLEGLRSSLQTLQIPGIKILRFALDEMKGTINQEYGVVAEYPVNTIAYTTTHDTETLLGYLAILTPEQKQILAGMARVASTQDDQELAKNLRDAIIASPARMVIIPIQDWLLTTDRINTPGTEVPVKDPNWMFRLDVSVEELPIIR